VAQKLGNISLNQLSQILRGQLSPIVTAAVTRGGIDEALELNGYDITGVGSLYVTSDLFVSGNLYLGDASSDIILSTAQLTASQGAQFSGDIVIVDDKKLHFGSDSDASIEYNEDGDDYLIISGSTNGVAISGSTISFDGNVKIASNYHTTTFESQLADGEMGSGEVLYYGPTADTSLTKGRLYFLKSDGVWTEADANDAAKTKSMIAVALGTSARTDGMLMRGFVKIPSTEVLNASPSGGIYGLPVYVSATTTGHLDLTAPSGTGDIVRVVGYCIDDDNGDILLLFRPDNTWVEIA
jgi:hypothetical protein